MFVLYIKIALLPLKRWGKHMTTPNPEPQHTLNEIISNITLGVKHSPKTGDVGMFALYIARDLSEVGIAFGETEWVRGRRDGPLVLDSYPQQFNIGPDNHTTDGQKFHCWGPQVPPKTEPILTGQYVVLQPKFILMSGSQAVPEKILTQCGDANSVSFAFQNEKMLDTNIGLEAFILQETNGWPITESTLEYSAGSLDPELQQYFELTKIPSVGDMGKCVMYHIEEEGKVGITFKVASKIKFSIPHPSDPETVRAFLRPYMENLQDHSNIGFHESISTPPGSCIISGAAFYVEPDGQIFIDRKSGDFGKMNKSLTEFCFNAADKRFATIDDKYFDLKAPNTYLEDRLINIQDGLLKKVKAVYEAS
jgi:hypothetical protein